MRQLLQMKGECGWRGVYCLGDVSGRHPLRPGLDQPAIDLQPRTGGKCNKCDNRVLRFHTSGIVELTTNRKRDVACPAFVG